MRLTASEKKALYEAIEGLREVYLFGSRTDDAGKGGDIDILIFSDSPAFQLSSRVSRAFFMRCEEKIDVVVMNPDRLAREQQAFLNTLHLVRLQ